MKARIIAPMLAVLAMALPAQAAPKSSASFEKALRDAEMVAALNPAWSVHRTSGDSMGDYFGDHSLILVQSATLAEVEPGMMIVYRSATGELISHKVVRREGDCVRTAGTENRTVDPEPVTGGMLLGVIFAVFHTEGGPAGPVLAADGRPVPTALCKSL